MKLQDKLEQTREEYKKSVTPVLKGMVIYLFGMLDISDAPGHNYAELLRQTKDLLSILEYHYHGQMPVYCLDESQLPEPALLDIINHLKEIDSL